MPSEVVAAWVAIVGVVISAGVSWMVARHAASTELRKQQLDLFKSYAEGLQKERLQTYPALYSLFSDSLKDFQRGTLTREGLAAMLPRFQQWDSAHSLLLSRSAANVMFDVQWYLHDLLSDRAALTPEACQAIAARFETAELALKQDLGVFAVEFEDNRKIKSYEQPSNLRLQPTPADTPPDRRG
jgi:hypothetical protein